VSKRLFVGNLAYSTMDHQLEALFAQHGKVVSANVVVDPASGQSRGFGFVEFETEPEAEAAAKALDGSTLDGRTIAVNEARPRAPRGGPGEGRGGGGGGRGGGGGGRGGGGGGGGGRDRGGRGGRGGGGDRERW
jgi:cold-inducible RNA-binding protein